MSKRADRTARLKSNREYRFKVGLKGRPIWRTIAMRGDQTLHNLHEAIFQAFDRYDPHLYSFYFPKAPSPRLRSGASKEYAAPELLDEPDLFGEEARLNAAKTRLDDLGLRNGQKFEYLFDFGDSWWHDGKVEAVGTVVPETRYPQVVDRRGESPPQYEAEDD